MPGLRFFADHCVPTEMVLRLRTAGYEVLCLRDILPTNSPDPDVIARAGELGCVLLSLNGDFADLVAYPPAQFKGIIAVQLHNHPEVIPAAMDRLLQYLAQHDDAEQYQGKLVIVEPHRIRIRA